MMWTECLWEDAAKAAILLMQEEEDKKGPELKAYVPLCTPVASKRKTRFFVTLLAVMLSIIFASYWI